MRKQLLGDYAASALKFATTISQTHNLNDIADSTDEGKKSFRSKRELTDRRLFSLAMNLSFDGIIMGDPSGTIFYVNKTILEMYGTDDAYEFVGKNVLDFIVKGEHERARQLSLESIRTGEGYISQFTAVRKDGTELPIEIAAAVVKEGSETIGFIDVIRNIDERKKAEQALSLAEQKLRTIFENVFDVVTYVDTKGKILDANGRVEELVGYNQEEIVGKYFTRLGLVSFAQLPKLMKLFVNTLKTGDAVKIVELELKHKDGRKVPVEVGTRFIKDNAGKTVGIVNIFRDVTERKKAEWALKESKAKVEAANKKLQVIGSLTRHDVRNKLMAAKGNSYLLKKRLSDQPDLLKFVEAIDLSIDQSNHIFEFNRLYEKMIEEEPIVMDVGDCFNQAIALVPKTETLVLMNECQGLRVTADKTLIQVFYTLFENSLRHGQKVSKIRLHYVDQGSQFQVFYEDDGVGISSENKSKLFTEGFSTGRSTGLGLFLIRKILDVYGWKIQEVGNYLEGARFVITIPH